MASTDLDSLLQVGVSADIDAIMSQIRAHVQKTAAAISNATPPAEGTPSKDQSLPMGEVFRAQAQFNHELMAALRLLGEEFQALREQLTLAQEQNRQTAEQGQATRQSLSTTQADVCQIKGDLTASAQQLATERDGIRRLRYELARQLAQLTERICQLDVVLRATGKRVDGVANRGYNTDRAQEQLRVLVEAEAAKSKELHARVTQAEARMQNLQEQLKRSADEMQQQWQADLASQQTTCLEQSIDFRTALDSMSAWYTHEFGAARERLDAELVQIRETVSSQAESNEALAKQFNSSIGDRIGALEHRIEEQGSLGLSAQGEFNQRLDALSDRIVRAEEAAKNGVTQMNLANAEQGTDGNGNPDAPLSVAMRPFDYFAFAEKYRGTVASVRERQAAYVALFQGRENVVDLGCGRGEFLELGSENGIHVTGVDASRDMVNYCRERGLNVVQADLFRYMYSLADGSLDGVFSAQVIEHMAPEQMRLLIHLCKQKLKPDSLLVLETINPLCGRAMADFWLDPTHVRPVPPKLLSYFLDELDFALEGLRFCSPLEGSACPESLHVDEWPADVDQYQDYAAIAKRL